MSTASAGVPGEPHVELDPPVPDTPLWLSHHWPADYDRCALLAGRQVCRRCLWMYPVAAVVAAVTSIGGWWPTSVDPWAIALLPLPAVADFVADNLGWARYVPRRQAALSALGAVGAGRGYLRYLHDHTDRLVWSVVAVYVVVCVAAALVRARSQQ